MGGVGEPWGGFSTKFLAYERALRYLTEQEVILKDDPVILTDAWDTVILGTSAELRQEIAELPPEAVLCGSERVCGPNHFLVGEMEQLYPDGQTPWRYPNSGGLVATANAMKVLLHGLVFDTEDKIQLSPDENDQVRLHDY